MLRRTLLAGLTAVLTSGSAQAKPRQNKEVLAFYYGWYRPEAHWGDPGPLHTPAAGVYDSHAPKTVARHLTEAKQAGLTGLIVSWWGIDDPTDRQLALLLPEAARAGLKIAVYIENAATPDILAEQLLYLQTTYGHAANWLKLDGRAVVFLYDRVLQTLGLDGWKSARARVEKTGRKALAYIATGNGRKQIAQRAPFVDGVHIYDMAYYLAQKRGLAWL